MYTTNKAKKADLAGRWALPDRVFFACGACHILAYAFMERFPDRGFKAVWIKPRLSHPSNHIVAVSGGTAFDYHGYSDWATLLAHTRRKARMRWPGWDADLAELPRDVLVSEAKSRTYDGLWLREPRQFLHDALPRARRFLTRFPAPEQSSIVRPEAVACSLLALAVMLLGDALGAPNAVIRIRLAVAAARGLVNHGADLWNLDAGAHRATHPARSRPRLAPKPPVALDVRAAATASSLASSVDLHRPGQQRRAAQADYQQGSP